VPHQGHPLLLHGSGDGAEVFRRKLALWGAGVALALVCVRLFLPFGNHVPSSALLAAGMGFCGCAGLGASVYCFAAFVFLRQIRYALASVGFCALCGGYVLQTVADLSGPTPALYDWFLVLAWLIAGTAFVGAVHSYTVLAPSGRLRSVVVSVLAGALVLGFPLAVLYYALDANVLYVFSAQPTHAFAACVAECAVCSAATVLLLSALRGAYRRYMANHDRASASLCFFFVPCVFALVARTGSFARFDEWSACWQILTVLTWLVFVCAVAVENAFAHREAQDRLEEMEVMHQVSWSLVGAGNDRELLEMLAQTVQQRLGARLVAVYLAEDYGQSLRVAAVSGLEECRNRVGSVYPVFSTDRRPGFHTGFTARAFTSRAVQIADDIFADVEFVPWRIVAQDDGCAVSLPLVDKGDALGVLNIYFSDREKLTRQRMRLLMTIAAAASPSIRQSCLCGAVSDQQHARELPRAA